MRNFADQGLILSQGRQILFRHRFITSEKVDLFLLNGLVAGKSWSVLILKISADGKCLMFLKSTYFKLPDSVFSNLDNFW